MEKPKLWANTQQVIAFLLVGGFIVVIFGWMFGPSRSFDQSTLAIINMLIGALVAKMTTVVDFYLGSSEGSKAKDDAQTKTIERLTSGTGNGAAVTAAAQAAAPAAARKAAPPAADIAAPPAAEIAVERALAERGVKDVSDTSEAWKDNK